MYILSAKVVEIIHHYSQPKVDFHPMDAVNRKLGPPIPHKILHICTHDLRSACWGAALYRLTLYRCANHDCLPECHGIDDEDMMVHLISSHLAGQLGIIKGWIGLKRGINGPKTTKWQPYLRFGQITMTGTDTWRVGASHGQNEKNCYCGMMPYDVSRLSCSTSQYLMDHEVFISVFPPVKQVSLT